MTKQGPVSRILDTTGISIIGAVADISAVVIVCTSDGLLGWVRDRPYLFAAVTAALLFLVALLASALFRLKAQLSQEITERISLLDSTSSQYRETIEGLENEIREIEAREAREVQRLKVLHEEKVDELTQRPSSQDSLRFQDFLSYFGTDSALYQWVKNYFYVSHAKRYQVRALDKFVKWYSDDLTNYHDPELAATFDQLKAATDSLYAATLSWYFQPQDETNYDELADLRIPSDWRFGELKSQWDQAVKDFEDSHGEVMESYGKFISLAHQKRMTEK